MHSTHFQGWNLYISPFRLHFIITVFIIKANIWLPFHTGQHCEDTQAARLRLMKPRKICSGTAAPQPVSRYHDFTLPVMLTLLPIQKYPPSTTPLPQDVSFPAATAHRHRRAGRCRAAPTGKSSEPAPRPRLPNVSPNGVCGLATYRCLCRQASAEV